MHYKNGREAKVGDIIVAKDYNGGPVSGVVVKTVASSDTCNLVVAPLAPTQFWVTAKEAVHLDDALSVAPPPTEAAA